MLVLAAGCSRPLSAVDAGGNGQLGGAGNGGGAAGAAGTPGGTGTAGGGGIGGGAGNAAGGAAATGGAAAMGGQGSGRRTQCTDGVDNDGDGNIDYDDPECLGGGDDDESTFAYGYLHETDTTCTQDCFFDGNSGMGDDGCRWQPRCDPASVVPGCPYDPLYAMEHVDACSLSASQSQRCVDTCGKLVPNGCDCFGCCVVPGLTTPIRLATTCTAADFGDPARCPPCTQVTQCLNPCDHCEFCIGKRALPDGCARPDGSAPYTCPTGSIACGATGVAPGACPAGTSCVTGCCLQQYAVP